MQRIGKHIGNRIGSVLSDIKSRIVVTDNILSPSNFNVTLINPNEGQIIRCTWDINAIYELEIYISINGGAFSLLTTVAPNTGIDDDAQLPYAELQYKARFKEDLTVLSKPLGLTAVKIAGGVRLTCNAVTDADHYQWYADIDNLGYVLVATTVPPTYDHTVDANAINYKVRAKEGTLPVYSSYSDVTAYADNSYLDKPLGTEYAYIVDNGALTINNDDYTLCVWFKYRAGDKLSNHAICGKAIPAGVAGRILLMSLATSGYAYAYVQSTGGTVQITSSIDISTGDWFFLRLDVNSSTKIIRLFVNEVQVGTDSSFTGTVNNPGNDYEFIIGAQNTADGSGFGNIAKGAFAELQIFNRVLSVADAAKAYAKQAVSTPKARYLFHEYPLVDSSGNGYDLTGVNLSSDNIIT